MFLLSYRPALVSGVPEIQLIVQIHRWTQAVMRLHLFREVAMFALQKNVRRVLRKKFHVCESGTADQLSFVFFTDEFVVQYVIVAYILFKEYFSINMQLYLVIVECE